VAGFKIQTTADLNRVLSLLGCGVSQGRVIIRVFGPRTFFSLAIKKRGSRSDLFTCFHMTIVSFSFKDFRIPPPVYSQAGEKTFHHPQCSHLPIFPCWGCQWDSYTTCFYNIHDKRLCLLRCCSFSRQIRFSHLESGPTCRSMLCPRPPERIFLFSIRAM